MAYLVQPIWWPLNLRSEPHFWNSGAFPCTTSICNQKDRKYRKERREREKRRSSIYIHKNEICRCKCFCVGVTFVSGQCVRQRRERRQLQSVDKLQQHQFIPRCDCHWKVETAHGRTHWWLSVNQQRACACVSYRQSGYYYVAVVSVVCSSSSRFASSIGLHGENCSKVINKQLTVFGLE